MKKELEELYNVYCGFIDGIEVCLTEEEKPILEKIGKKFETLIEEAKTREKWVKVIAKLRHDYKLRIRASEDNKYCAEINQDPIGLHFQRGYLDAYEEVNKDLEKLISKA
jgi:hypothetical protein